MSYQVDCQFCRHWYMTQESSSGTKFSALLTMTVLSRVFSLLCQFPEPRSYRSDAKRDKQHLHIQWLHLRKGLLGLGNLRLLSWEVGMSTIYSRGKHCLIFQGVCYATALQRQERAKNMRAPLRIFFQQYFKKKHHSNNCYRSLSVKWSHRDEWTSRLCSI